MTLPTKFCSHDPLVIRIKHDHTKSWFLVELFYLWRLDPCLRMNFLDSSNDFILNDLSYSYFWIYARNFILLFYSPLHIHRLCLIDWVYEVSFFFHCWASRVHSISYSGWMVDNFLHGVHGTNNYLNSLFLTSYILG